MEARPVGRIVGSILLVLAIIYIVPFIVYGVMTLVTSLEPPKDVSPARFLSGILVSKVGTAVAFVLIFYFARDALASRWFLYALCWWIMFTIGEVGQAIGPNYSWSEAIGGIISETIYCPLAAWTTYWLVKA